MTEGVFLVDGDRVRATAHGRGPWDPQALHGGASAALLAAAFEAINADLTIHLQRTPRGEWIGLFARTLLRGGGTGLAESTLHDEQGAVARAFQTLVVQPR
jgi:hypothetical protein